MFNFKTILHIFAVCILSVSISADIINGGFTSNLTGWDYNSGVLYSDDPVYPDSACLYPPVYEEDPLYSSILSQQFDGKGMNLLTFSFFAAVVGEGDETDHFYASILDETYASTLSDSVIPAPGIDPVPADKSLVSYGSPGQPYFFHWSSDPAEDPELAGGVIMSAAEEEGWLTISLFLPSGLNSATLRFELIHNHDPEDAQTTIYIDNVALSSTAVIPVPGAVLLAGLGSCLVVFFRRKSR